MTDSIFRIESITQLNQILGLETYHPLISVIDFSQVQTHQFEGSFTTNLYTVMLKGGVCGAIKYGRSRYDYQEETMVFFAPNQLIAVDSQEGQEQGANTSYGVFFHPDLLQGTSLASSIRSYNFFSYEVNEALHLSQKEKVDILACFHKIETEITRPIDKHTRKLVVHVLDLLLGYCDRFYDRQFITRETVNKDVLTRFESLLKDYYYQNEGSQVVLPTVKYFADKLALSPSYLSDLIRKETGRGAQEHLQNLVIEEAKIRLSSTNQSISEIAYALGFEYPAYFSRQFKKKTGFTPNTYRAQA